MSFTVPRNYGMINNVISFFTPLARAMLIIVKSRVCCLHAIQLQAIITQYIGIKIFNIIFIISLCCFFITYYIIRLDRCVR